MILAIYACLPYQNLRNSLHHFMTELRMRNGINLSEPLALDEKMARMR